MREKGQQALSGQGRKLTSVDTVRPLYLSVSIQSPHKGWRAEDVHILQEWARFWQEVGRGGGLDVFTFIWKGRFTERSKERKDFPYASPN